MMKTHDLLVIGYGNTLRGDDGLGPRVAEAVAGEAERRFIEALLAMLTPVIIKTGSALASG